jgi:CelD/BcsL family acetyltransferase involved in cellulose biosynthesis
VSIVIVDPWKDARWDAYVASHPRATVYHTAGWIRIVCETGRYPSLCLLHETDGRVSGVMPLAAVDSAITGRRISTLPFSDMCFPLADDAATAAAFLERVPGLRTDRRAAFHEMRGLPALREGSDVEAPSYARSGHFYNFVIPLTDDPEKVRMTFSRTGVRQVISKGLKLGVTVRLGEARDLDAFYTLYVRNRMRHGIPPQPKKLFASILERPGDGAKAMLYLAEHEGTAVAALIMLRYNGVTYAKYEGVDETRRDLQALYPLFWKTIEDAVLAGDRVYDFGRTAGDNPGLCQFKQKWGTTQTEMPYYFDPPGEGMSVVKSDSLKYRLFTGAFRRMPAGLAVKIGGRIFRHFG